MIDFKNGGMTCYRKRSFDTEEIALEEMKFLKVSKEYKHIGY